MLSWEWEAEVATYYCEFSIYKMLNLIGRLKEIRGEVHIQLDNSNLQNLLLTQYDPTVLPQFNYYFLRRATCNPVYPNYRALGRHG